jgi:RIO kinase 1
VPVPYHFIEGVLLMELVTDEGGHPAPRLGDLPFDAASARAMYDRLIRATVQMLCAGVVHGDLSEFNVLIAADGPVVIDFPQSVDSAHNANARKLLIRDVDNLHRFLARHVPSARRAPLAEEMWSLHEQNLLTPDTRLRGDFRVAERVANTASVLELIGDANRDERKRRDALGLRGGPAEPNGGAGARTSASQPSRGGAPKKDAPVYQGLKNEGLKFFRHLADKPQGGSGGSPRNGRQGQGPRQQGQGQRPQGQGQRPQGQGQRPQGQGPRPQAQEQRQQGQGQRSQAQEQRPQAQGQRSQGEPQAQGQRPQAQGQRSQGEPHPQGQRPQAQGQRPQGEPHPQGQRPQAQGQRPQGQHAQRRRSRAQGHRPQAQHPQVEQRRPSPSPAAAPPAPAAQGPDRASEAPRPHRAAHRDTPPDE